jgi:hypothetical protein
MDQKIGKIKVELKRGIQSNIIKELRETDIKDSFNQIESQVLKSVSKLE